MFILNKNLFKNKLKVLILIFCILMHLSSCATHRLYHWSASYYKPADYNTITANTKGKFAKLHYADGSVVVYQNWTIENHQIKGLASKYDLQRNVVYHDQQKTLPLTDVEFVETNQAVDFKDDRVPLVVISAIATVLVGGICVVAFLYTGKACFGSCPTIYGNPEALGSILAESFSDAIAKSLENQDIDPLLGVRANENQNIELAITNEAYESHLIKKMDLLAFDPKQGHEIYHQGDRFFEISQKRKMDRCQHLEDQTDCLVAIEKEDQSEALSKTSEKDLGLKESYRLAVDFHQHTNQDQSFHVGDRYALTLSLRNSLLNTFLFYQAWAWLGAKAGDWLARLNQAQNPNEMFSKISKIFGDLQVNARLNDGDQKGDWVNIGAYDEIGPIAKERVLFEVPQNWIELMVQKPSQKWSIEFDLLASRSNYRIDMAQFVKLEKEHQPRVVHLKSLKNQDGTINELGTKTLLEGKRHFLIQSAEHFILSYHDQKATANTQYFLAATGYYLEWMQKGWLGEASEDRLIDLMVNPEQTLKDLAPAYKQIEPFIDQEFWNTRVKKKDGIRK
jgi:hypothetical protein